MVPAERPAGAGDHAGPDRDRAGTAPRSHRVRTLGNRVPKRRRAAPKPEHGAQKQAPAWRVPDMRHHKVGTRPAQARARHTLGQVAHGFFG